MVYIIASKKVLKRAVDRNRARRHYQVFFAILLPTGCSPDF